MLVVYKSNTGFTQKYAQWIGETLNCEVKTIEQTTTSDVANQDIVIYGGWLLAGKIKDLDKIRGLNPKKLVIFAVGYKPKGPQNEDIRKENDIKDEPFFYFEGGLNPKKMSGLSKAVIHLITKEKIEFVDHTNKEDINELVRCVRELTQPSNS